MLRKCVFPLVFVAALVLAVLPHPVEGKLTSATSPDEAGSIIDPNGGRLRAAGDIGRWLDRFGALAGTKKARPVRAAFDPHG